MNPLKNQHRWVTWPSTVSALVGVALALLYAVFTVEIVPGTRLAFAAIMVVVVLTANLLGDREEQGRLRTLQALGDGRLAMNVDNLTRALAEAAKIPEVTFWVNLAFWFFGAVSVGILYGLVPGVKWATSSRVAFIGIALAPLVAMLAHLMVLRRSRALMGTVAAQGLTATDLLRAVPADRFQLRRRFIFFMAVAVVTPLTLVCDLGAATGLSSVAALLEAPNAQAQLHLLAEQQSAGLLPLLLVAGLVLLVVVMCGYQGGRSIDEPLKALAMETERIANGRIGRSSVIPAEDEVWAVSAGFGSMEAQLLTALKQLKDAGVKIGNTTEELISSSQKHEAGAADQTGALSQTSATTEELARSAKQIAQNASDVSRLAAQMLDAAHGGKRSAGAFYASILRVREGNQAIADSVVRLNKRVQQVGRIVEFIDGIADKSDLLALNAELEGTKAGEVGRGFSLVAAEMRRLSESVMSSTREINRLIEEIRDATNAAVMATEAGVKATDAGSALARQVTESLDRIVAFANQTSDAVKAITLATHQQQAGTDQLATAMADILRSTHAALGATVQMSTANNDLSSLSKELQTTVSRFEVGGVSPADAAPVFGGRARWLLATYAWGNAAGAYLAALYAYQTLDLGGGAGRLLSVWAVPALAGVLYWIFAGARRLRTIRWLASGRATLSEDSVISAIREARALPDWVRRLTQVSWPSSALVAALFARFGAGVETPAVLRMFLGCAAFGPLIAELVYLLAIRRSRLLVASAAALVPARNVVSALANEKSRRVRARLVMLTITLVVIPSALMVDVTRVRSQGAQAAVVAAPRELQETVAQVEVRSAVLGSLALGLSLIAFALGAAFLAGSSLAGPLKHIADESNRVSRGDLRDVRVVAAEDELWAVTSSFTLLQAQLQEVVGQLQRAGLSIGSTTEELMATSSKYEAGAADQASSLNETSATTEELAQSARQISHNAASVSDLAVKTFEAARAGQDSAQAFVSAVDRMRHDNQSIAEAVTRLQKRVQQIGRIVEFITTVADRSDLLALSAELEGTKAGEVGRGFTLVAAEMRRLAENVIESTNEIEELISEIREATLGTVTATARGMEHTQSGTALAGAVAESLSKVVELAQHTSDSVRAISLATQQQQSSTDQLAEAMADILGITQQSLAATKQVTSANHELITLSGDLKSVVDRFQTGLK